MASHDLEEDADQELSNYRKKLVFLDSELDSDNLKCLKYLCFDVIPASKLEKITQGTDLFRLLEQGGNLGNGNYFFLAECLSKICRRDLSEELIGHDLLKIEIENSGSKISDHRSLWFEIAEDLDGEEVSKCLYYYGNVPKSKIGGIKSGINFLTFLEKMKKISSNDMDYLEDILKTIERNDLVKLIQKLKGQSSRSVSSRPRAPPPTTAAQQFDEELDLWKAREKERSPSEDEYDSWKSKEKERVSGDYTVSLPPESTGLPSYSKTSLLEMPMPMPMQITLAYQICSEPDNIPKFGKALGLSKNQIDQIMINNAERPDMKVLELMRIWSQQSQAESEDKSNELIDALKESGLSDLAEDLKIQLSRLNESLGPEPKVNNPEPQEILPELPVNGTRNYHNIVPSHTDGHQNLYISSGEARQLNPGEEDIYVRQMNADIGTVRPPPPLLEEYRMNRIPRGICVIFNNEKFTYDPRNPDAKRMNDRLGSSIDRDKSEETFTDLGFIVYVHNNLTAVEMVRFLNQYSQQDHSQFDCFVCVILSHGTRDNIYGSNCISVPIRTLTDPLKNLSCPGLCGKPKLFFIQACQGQDKQHGRDIERDSVCDLYEDAPVNGEVIPNEQDFLIGMATIPGFVSYRSKTSGSWYIIKLCEALEKYAEHWDILHILTQVNSEVGKANANIDGMIFKQSPGPLYTLRKRLVFQPLADPRVNPVLCVE